MHMTRQTLVQLTDELVALLDRRAAQQQVSRSALIRDVLEQYLAADREAALDQALRDGYERQPQGGQFDADEWGDLGAMLTGLMVETLDAVAEEERDAGFEPW